jgi:hypothetical protein
MAAQSTAITRTAENGEDVSEKKRVLPFDNIRGAGRVA